MYIFCIRKAACWPCRDDEKAHIIKHTQWIGLRAAWPFQKLISRNFLHGTYTYLTFMKKKYSKKNFFSREIEIFDYHHHYVKNIVR